MAKKKDSEALFEIISRNKSPQGRPGIAVPDWMKPRPPEEAQTPQKDAPPEQQEQSDSIDVEAEAKKAPEAQPTPPPISPAVPAHPVEPADSQEAPQAEPDDDATIEEPPADEPLDEEDHQEPDLDEPQMQPPDLPPDEDLAETTEPTMPAPRPMPAPAVKDKPAMWPLVAVRNGRVEVSLSPLSCLVVAIGLALLMVGMVEIGKQLTPAQVQVGGPNAPPNQDVLGPDGRAELQRRTPQRPPEPRRTPGKYYMMIAAMPGNTAQDRTEAQRIMAFCARAQMPATINLVDGQYVVVYSLTPFERPDSEQALQYAEKIRTLGEAYQEQQAGSPGFFQKDPQGNWPWFVPYPGTRATPENQTE